MPLRHQAQQMRDLYTNAIAAAATEGRRPSEHELSSWVRHRDAADSHDPDATLTPAAATTADGALLLDSVGAPTDPMFSLGTSAERLGISELRLHALIESGELRATFYAGAPHISGAELNRHEGTQRAQ